MTRNRRPSGPTLILLDALMRRPGDWQYGYELSQSTGLKSGTLYPLLMRLSDRGLLESQWQPPTHAGRPPRHVYRLTAAGASVATEALLDQAGDIDLYRGLA